MTTFLEKTSPSESSVMVVLLVCVIVAFGFKAYFDGFFSGHATVTGRSNTTIEYNATVASASKSVSNVLLEQQTQATGRTVANQ